MYSRDVHPSGIEMERCATFYTRVLIAGEVGIAAASLYSYSGEGGILEGGVLLGGLIGIGFLGIQSVYKSYDPQSYSHRAQKPKE